MSLHCFESVFYNSYTSIIMIIIILLPFTYHPTIILEHTMSYDFIHIRVSKVVKKGNAEFSSHWHVLHITFLSTYTRSIIRASVSTSGTPRSVSISPDFKAFVSSTSEEPLFHPPHIPSPSIVPYLLPPCFLLFFLFLILCNSR